MLTVPYGNWTCNLDFINTTLQTAELTSQENQIRYYTELLVNCIFLFWALHYSHFHQLPASKGWGLRLWGSCSFCPLCWNCRMELLFKFRRQSHERISAKLWYLMFSVRGWSRTFQRSQEEKCCSFGQKGQWESSSLIHFLCTSFPVSQSYFCLRFLP